MRQSLKDETFKAEPPQKRSHLWDGEGWRPLGSQDVQADGAVAVDVGVVDAGGERELGRLEGVVCGEVDVQEENTACN